VVTAEEALSNGTFTGPIVDTGGINSRMLETILEALAIYYYASACGTSILYLLAVL
jgi:hypothetical protein